MSHGIFLLPLGHRGSHSWHFPVRREPDPGRLRKFSRLPSLPSFAAWFWSLGLTLGLWVRLRPDGSHGASPAQQQSLRSCT